jgi:hypothetical protein
MKMIFKPVEVGWRLGRAYEPRGGGSRVPWDRTAGVIGPQGNGKTLAAERWLRSLTASTPTIRHDPRQGFGDRAPSTQCLRRRGCCELRACLGIRALLT